MAVPIQDHPVPDDGARCGRADGCDDIDDRRPGALGGDPLPDAERGVEGLGAPDRAFVNVGRMPRQAAGDVSVGPRIVHDDRGGCPQAADLARHGLALRLRGGVVRSHRPVPAVGGGHHDKIGPGRIGRPDRPRSPGGALGVLAPYRWVVHAHVDERAGCLDEGDQAPSIALRQDVEGREPVPGMRVTDQHDRGVGVGIAVDTIGGLRSFEPGEASVIGETLAIRPCVAERRLDIPRQPCVTWESLRRDLPPLDQGRPAPGGDRCRGGGRRQRRLPGHTSCRLRPGGAAGGRSRSGRGLRCRVGDRRLDVLSMGGTDHGPAHGRRRFVHRGRARPRVGAVTDAGDGGVGGRLQRDRPGHDPDNGRRPELERQPGHRPAGNTGLPEGLFHDGPAEPGDANGKGKEPNGADWFEGNAGGDRQDEDRPVPQVQRVADPAKEAQGRHPEEDSGAPCPVACHDQKYRGAGRQHGQQPGIRRTAVDRDRSDPEPCNAGPAGDSDGPGRESSQEWRSDGQQAARRDLPGCERAASRSPRSARRPSSRPTPQDSR